MDKAKEAPESASWRKQATVSPLHWNVWVSESEEQRRVPRGQRQRRRGGLMRERAGEGGREGKAEERSRVDEAFCRQQWKDTRSVISWAVISSECSVANLVSKLPTRYWEWYIHITPFQQGQSWFLCRSEKIILHERHKYGLGHKQINTHITCMYKNSMGRQLGEKLSKNAPNNKKVGKNLI